MSEGSVFLRRPWLDNMIDPLSLGSITIAAGSGIVSSGSATLSAGGAILSTGNTALFVADSVSSVYGEMGIDGTLRSARWRHIASQALENCRHLTYSNWDGENAVPISPECVRIAQDLLVDILSCGRRLPDIAPSPDGSIGMEWWNGKARVFLDIGPENIVRIYYNPGDGQPYEEEPIEWRQRNITSKINSQLEKLYPSAHTETRPVQKINGFDLSHLGIASATTNMELGCTIVSSRNSRPQSRWDQITNQSSLGEYDLLQDRQKIFIPTEPNTLTFEKVA
jgi:hypothetical protein